MTLEEIQKRLEEMDVQVLLADGFEDALIGIGMQFNKPLAIYDCEKCLDILMHRYGMSYEDAEEYLCFNVYDAYVGEQTPVFMVRLKEDDE